MVGRSPASVEMRTPAVASAMVHVFVLAAAILNLDFFSRPPPIEPEPVMVEFEAIDKKAAAPTVGNPPPQPKDVPIAQETTKAPPPKTRRAAAGAAAAQARGRRGRSRRRPNRRRSPSPKPPSRPRRRLR